MTTQTGNTGTTPNRGHGKSNGKNSGTTQKKADYYCLYHRQNSTHNTNWCKVLKTQAECMASQHKTAAGKYKGRYKSNNSKKCKAEFQLFAVDIVEKVFKKMKKSSLEERNKKENFSFSKF